MDPTSAPSRVRVKAALRDILKAFGLQGLLDASIRDVPHRDSIMLSQRRYSFLDGLRGLAAIFVLTRHTQDFWHHEFYRSYLAVDLFFILSGFVIARAYEKKLESGAISIGSFLKIRLIRLYPVFLLSVLICAVTMIGALTEQHAANFSDLIIAAFSIGMTLLFLPSYMAGSDMLFPLNGVYWSLFFELIANALYAFARPKLDGLVLYAIIVFSGLGVIVLACLHRGIDAGFTWTLPHVGAGFLRSIFGIFLGIFLYRNHARFHRFFEFISPWYAFPVVGLILASANAGAFNAIIDIVCVCIIFPVCVVVASQNIMTRYEGALLMLGSASYPMYVLHDPVSKIPLYAWSDGINKYAPLSGIVFVAFLIGLSVMIEKFYDIPVRRRLSKIFLPKG
jgi:peptidoglycan/LPS O-acetylase OafA/YrhL